MTRGQQTGAGIIGVILAFLLANRAIFTGSYWQYLGTLILLILSARLLAKAFRGDGK